MNSGSGAGWKKKFSDGESLRKVEMRNKEREINAMLDGFIEERQIIHLEQTEHFVGHEESFFHGVDAYYHETLLFIEMKWSKVFNVRPRLSLFIFFTSETLAFILAGFFHKRMLRRLQNMQHKIKVI